MRGCDLAWGVIPGRELELAKALKREGFHFVVRYLSRDPSKNLTKAEVKAYRHVGLHIVTVYEDAADAMLGGEPVGHAQAVTAKQQLAALGAPAHAPVYFAADFPATSGQIPAVDQALDGTALVLTESLNGIYGEYALTSAAKHVRYRWQTVAWSAGRWSPSDHIRQFAISGTTDRVQWDLDESMVADFGQWVWPKEKPLTPPPPKKHPVKRVVHKVKTGTKKTVKHEPVVTAAGASGALSAAVALLASKLGLHLTTIEMHSILTALPALAALFAAFRTTPATVTAITGALATIGTAAVAFGLHMPTGFIGADAPVAALGVALLLRTHVSPKSVAADANPIAGDIERIVDKLGVVLHRANQVSQVAPAPAPVPVPVPVAAAPAVAAPVATVQVAAPSAPPMLAPPPPPTH